MRHVAWPDRLNERNVAKDIAQRLAQPLAAVDHPQHAPGEREPAGEQVLQQVGTYHGVLRGAQAQTLRDLAAVARNPQDDDYRLLGHHDAVHEQRHHPEPVQPPRQVLVQPLPSPPHDGPTDRTLATAAGGPPARRRLQTAGVVARRHPGQSCCIIRVVRGSRSRNAATEGNVASPPIVCRTRGRRTCTRRPPKVSSVAAVPQ